MTVRKTFQWMLIILLLAIVGGGGYGWWMWSRSDDMLRDIILAKIQEKAPGWNVTIDRVHYDWQRRVVIQGIQLRAKEQQNAILTIPETIITIDRDALVDRQQIIVHKIQVHQPAINILRNANGVWNFQELPPLPKSKSESHGSPPEIIIEQAVIHVLLQHGEGIKAGEMTIDNADFKLVPSGNKQFIIQGLSHVNQAGNLVIEGEWDSAKKGWSIHGQMKGVTTNGELSSLAFSVAPHLRDKFTKANAALQKKLVSAATTNRPVPQEGQSDESSSLLSLSDNAFAKVGIEATVDVTFRIAKWNPKEEPDFAIHVDIMKGEISNPVLPFPLRNLQGSLDWDNSKIVLHKLTATNDQTKLSLVGHVKRTPESLLSRYDLSIINLQFDKRLRTRLPQSMWKLYDNLRPTGFADVHCSLMNDATGKWDVQNFLFEAKNVGIQSIQFPYPAKQIIGYAKQRPGTHDLELSFNGRAGKQPFIISGYVKNAGPKAEMGLDLRIENVPVDKTLISSCKKEGRKALESLNVNGSIDDVHVVLYRPPGLKKKMQIELIAKFKKCDINYEKFPYAVNDISGHVLFASTTGKWQFRNLVGFHNSAKIGMTGYFEKRNPQDQGFLQLTILSKEGQFDNSLKRALPESVQQAWMQISPQGKMDARAEIDWVPGKKPIITIPELVMKDASIQLQSFPYLLKQVNGKFKYENDRVEILAFDGTHNKTTVAATGFMECPHNERGDWRVRLKEIYITQLTPDKSFRKALPESLQEAIVALNPQRKLSVLGMVEFRGTVEPNNPTTAAWDIEILLPDNELTTGVDLTKVKGHVFVEGNYDGREVKLQGELDLDHATVFDYTFHEIRGPFKLIDKQLVIGSSEALVREKRTPQQKTIDPGERITARFIKGVVTLDVVALLSEETPYRLKATVSRGRLEEFSRLYIPNVKNIQGITNGWIDLHGRGPKTEKISGRGQLQIHPAALYELPAMVQMFKVLNFAPPGKTAFNYAFADFTVANNNFNFKRIDLAGDAISFRGSGKVGFDSRLNLDFYSMLPRQRIPIPLLGPLLGNAAKGWVGVQLRGKTSQPVAKVTQAPILDEAMKIFNVPQLLFQPLSPEQVKPLRNSGRFPRRYRLR